MADTIHVGTEPVFINTSDAITIANCGGGTLYYDNVSSVSSTSNDGSIASGARLETSSPTWLVGTTPTTVIVDRGISYKEVDTGTGKVRFGDLPDLYTGRTGIMFTSDNSNWVGFEHETNLHLNAYGSFFHIRTSSSAFNVCAGTSSTGATSTVFSVDTSNAITFVNGKLQFGSLSGSDTALERNAEARVGTVSGVGFIVNTADLYVRATTGATAIQAGAIGPSSQAGINFGTDSYIYRRGGGVLNTQSKLESTSEVVGRYGAAAEVSIGGVGPASQSGITFGSSQDIKQYRVAADFLSCTKAIGTDYTTAPADASLAAGQVSLYFDSSNGAAKLKIKGKSANGTVVAGEVALA